MTAIIVLYDLVADTFWNLRDRTASPKHRALENFPVFECPIIKDKATI
jgi:hypothetical protein